MNISFKTPALYNLLIFLYDKYPAKKTVISSFIPKFANINLSYYNNEELQNVYRQEIILITGEIVYIFWNIDSIIYNIKNTKNITPKLVPIESIINNSNILHGDFDGLLSDMKCDFKIGYRHKLEPIIISQLPFFSQKTVIDGNHRLLEAYKAGARNISYIYINPQDAIQFLQKDSQQFILLIAQLYQALGFIY